MRKYLRKIIFISLTLVSFTAFLGFLLLHKQPSMMVQPTMPEMAETPEMVHQPTEESRGPLIREKNLDSNTSVASGVYGMIKEILSFVSGLLGLVLTIREFRRKRVHSLKNCSTNLVSPPAGAGSRS